MHKIYQKGFQLSYGYISAHFKEPEMVLIILGKEYELSWGMPSQKNFRILQPEIKSGSNLRVCQYEIVTEY